MVTVSVRIRIVRLLGRRGESGLSATEPLQSKPSVAGMGGDGTVVLLGEQVNGEIQIHVKDLGCGIAPKTLEKIWEPFLQRGETRGEGSDCR